MAQSDERVTVWLDVWRVPAVRIPGALWRMAIDPRRLRRTPGVRFAKLLGTGRGNGFGPMRTDLTRWAAVTVTDGTPPAFSRWAALAAASCRLVLRPISSRGTWSGRTPFEPEPDAGEGPVLALTRARLRPAKAVTFWRAIAPVARALPETPGLLTAFGIGEAPLGWQGTVSVWRGHPDLVRFAYRHPEHRRAIARTPTANWYAEELFARFTVLDIQGDTGVIGWVEGRRLPA